MGQTSSGIGNDDNQSGKATRTTEGDGSTESFDSIGNDDAPNDGGCLYATTNVMRNSGGEGMSRAE